MQCCPMQFAQERIEEQQLRMEMQAKHGMLKPRLPIQYGKKNVALGCAPAAPINPLRVLPPVCARADGAENMPQPSARRPGDEQAVATDPLAHALSHRAQHGVGKPIAPAPQEAAAAQSTLDCPRVPASAHPPAELVTRIKNKASALVADEPQPAAAAVHFQPSGPRPQPTAMPTAMELDVRRPAMRTRAEADEPASPPKLAFSQPVRNLRKVPAASALYVACCLLHAACCMLLVACCLLHAACCIAACRTACCILRGIS